MLFIRMMMTTMMHDDAYDALMMIITRARARKGILLFYVRTDGNQPPNSAFSPAMIHVAWDCSPVTQAWRSRLGHPLKIARPTIVERGGAARPISAKHSHFWLFFSISPRDTV